MSNTVANLPARRLRFWQTTVGCQLHMRHFSDGDEIYLEPWRAKAFPVIKDLTVDRGSFDRIIAAAGFISVPTGSAPGIARTNRDYIKAAFLERPEPASGGESVDRWPD
jgi:hypothetical protein